MTTKQKVLLACWLCVLVSATALLYADTFSAITGSGPGSSFVTGDRWTASIAEAVRQDLNVLVGAKYVTTTADANLTNETNLGALTTGLIKNSVSGGNATLSTATAGTDYVSPSSTETLTNKTLDAEGTGNLLTLPFTQFWTAAICQNVTAVTDWNLPTSNPAAAACVTGTNTQKGTLDFADGASSLSAQRVFRLPSDWTGALDVSLRWSTSATSGNVVWQVATACATDGATDDPAFNTANTVTDAAKAVANQLNDATISSLTTTGCAAGSTLHLKVFRDPANASDTLAATASLTSVTVTYRRAM